MNFQGAYERYTRKRILQYLRTTSSLESIAIIEKKVLNSLRKAVKYSPAYSGFLGSQGINHRSIQDLDEFTRQIPVLTKQNFYEKYSPAQLLGQNLKKVKLYMASSGFSGSVSYGFLTAENLKQSKSGIDNTVNYLFNTDRQKTFMINCMPMGVHVETGISIAETSVRSDIALSLIKQVSPAYEQTIVIADPHFLKKIIEEGCSEGINWKALNISFVTGQDWMPESLRKYLCELTKIPVDINSGRNILTTMGMTELGLNVFHESKYTVALRRAILADKELKQKLVPDIQQTAPIFFHYYPTRTYIETQNTPLGSELLFTVTDKNSLLPLIRYSTGDCGTILSYKSLTSILAEKYKNLLPDIKTPIGILQGRIRNRILYKGELICIEDIKEGLYTQTEVAASVTGLIKLVQNNDSPEIQIHLKKGIQISKKLEEKIRMAVHSYITPEIAVKSIGYSDFENALDLNYERKLYV